MKGYKATDKDMECLDFQFEMDKEFTHEGKIELCKSGFHFCTDMFDCFKYYHNAGVRLFEVECEDVNDKVQHASSKRVCQRIKFVKEIIIGEQDEEFYLNMIKKEPYSIGIIENPSIELQLVAIKQNEWAIQYIKNPSTEVQLAAVKQDRYVIDCIENPSRDVIKYLDLNLNLNI